MVGVGTGARAAYVVAVVVLAVVATADPHDLGSWAWYAAIVATLPGFVVTLPVFYVVAALGWNAGDALDASWPTTLGYAVAFGLAAAADVALLWLVRSVRRSRRQTSPTP
jgi:hypothetical protein